MFAGWPRLSVRAPGSVTRFPGPVSGTCSIGSRSPWPPPFAPPPPLPVARHCSAASLLLWRSLTSHARASSASVPHLPDADQSALQPVAGHEISQVPTRSFSDVMWPSTPAERRLLAKRYRTYCLRRFRASRPPHHPFFLCSSPPPPLPPHPLPLLP